MKHFGRRLALAALFCIALLDGIFVGIAKDVGRESIAAGIMWMNAGAIAGYVYLPLLWDAVRWAARR